jgi:Rod binding domain-containing protein
MLSQYLVPPQLLAPPIKAPAAVAPTPSAGDAAPASRPVATPEQRSRIAGAAQSFEAQMLSQMMQPMFEGLSTAAPFGGGAGEETYRSFLVDAFARQMAKAGGVGVSKAVMAEMLKMQGLQ